jgi:hypothetical protein
MSGPRPLRLPSTFRYVAFGAIVVCGAIACSASSSPGAGDAAVTDGSKVADGSGDACPGAGYCGNLMDAGDAGCPDANVCSMADCPGRCTFI